MDRQLQARIAPITSRLWMLAAKAAQPAARKPKPAAKLRRDPGLRAAA